MSVELKKEETIQDLFESEIKDIKENIKPVTNICNDSYIGLYEKEEEEITFKSSDRKFGIEIDKEKITERLNIVIIIESPHKQEFKELPYLPAQGVTGDKIKQYLPELFSKLKESNYLTGKSYNIILMNSIQYQCSLGWETAAFRDIVWNNLWRNLKVKNDFKERIKNYSPTIIINLCTGKNTRRKYVQQFINNIDFNQEDIKVLRGPHPSGWMNTNNRYVLDRDKLINF